MNIPHQRYKKIKSIVNILTVLLDTTDPFKICNLLEIEISYIPLSSNIFGFVDIGKFKSKSIYPQKPSLYIPNAKIFISTHLKPYSQKIVCAHELGHILLRKRESLNLFDVENPGNDLTEYEANLFAIELMPDIYNSPINYLLLSQKELYDYMNNIIAF